MKSLDEALQRSKGKLEQDQTKFKRHRNQIQQGYAYDKQLEGSQPLKRSQRDKKLQLSQLISISEAQLVKSFFYMGQKGQGLTPDEQVYFFQDQMIRDFLQRVTKRFLFRQTEVLPIKKFSKQRLKLQTKDISVPQIVFIAQNIEQSKYDTFDIQINIPSHIFRSWLVFQAKEGAFRHQPAIYIMLLVKNINRTAILSEYLRLMQLFFYKNKKLLTIKNIVMLLLLYTPYVSVIQNPDIVNNSESFKPLLPFFQITGQNNEIRYLSDQSKVDNSIVIDFKGFNQNKAITFIFDYNDQTKNKNIFKNYINGNIFFNSILTTDPENNFKTTTDQLVQKRQATMEKIRESCQEIIYKIQDKLRAVQKILDKQETPNGDEKQSQYIGIDQIIFQIRTAGQLYDDMLKTASRLAIPRKIRYINQIQFEQIQQHINRVNANFRELTPEKLTQFKYSKKTDEIMNYVRQFANFKLETYMVLLNLIIALYTPVQKKSMQVFIRNSVQYVIERGRILSNYDRKSLLKITQMLNPPQIPQLDLDLSEIRQPERQNVNILGLKSSVENIMRQVVKQMNKPSLNQNQLVSYGKLAAIMEKMAPFIENNKLIQSLDTIQKANQAFKRIFSNQITWNNGKTNNMIQQINEITSQLQKFQLKQNQNLNQIQQEYNRISEIRSNNEKQIQILAKQAIEQANRNFELEKKNSIQQILRQKNLFDIQKIKMRQQVDAQLRKKQMDIDEERKRDKNAIIQLQLSNKKLLNQVQLGQTEILQLNKKQMELQRTHLLHSQKCESTITQLRRQIESGRQSYNNLQKKQQILKNALTKIMLFYFTLYKVEFKQNASVFESLAQLQIMPQYMLRQFGEYFEQKYLSKLNKAEDLIGKMVDGNQQLKQWLVPIFKKEFVTLDEQTLRVSKSWTKYPLSKQKVRAFYDSIY